MLFDFLSADGGKGVSYTRKQHAQVVVDFGRGADGRTWISGNHLLFNGNGRRNTLDEVAVGLVHSPEKLSGIGRKAFHITPLSFGIERIKSERRLTAAAHTRDDHKFISWYINVYVFQVVDPSTSNPDHLANFFET